MKDLDMNDLRKGVNRLDKKLKVKINNPDFYKEPEAMFFFSAMTFREYLQDMIRLLNGVPDSVQGIPNIVRLSKLEWTLDKKYDIDSYIYRARFLTLFLTEISDHIVELCEKEFRYHSPRVGIYEHCYFYLLDISTKVSNFVYLFLEGNDWRNLIVKMLEYTFLMKTKKKKRAESLIENSKEMIFTLRKGAYHTWFKKQMLEDSILVDYILKLAVLICGGTGECNAVPGFEEFEHKVPGVDNYKYEIAYVGKAVLGAHKDYRDCALMYRIFNDASPSLVYNFENINTNTFMNVGCRALDFVSFILDDKCCEELIDKILGRTVKRWVW